MSKRAASSSQKGIPPSKRGKSSNGYIRVDGLSHPPIKRAREIDADPPYEKIEALLKEQRTDHQPRNVLHWFRSKDLRIEDNRALDAASRKAKQGKGQLLTIYLFTPQDMEWHGTSPARSDFLLQSLQLVQEQLETKNIPLAILIAKERGTKVSCLMDFVKKWDVSHVFANYEYEIDELRRDINIVKKVGEQKDLSFQLLHDQTVIEPGTIKTGGGGPAKVFTPYHKMWLWEVKQHPELLKLVDPPGGNEKNARQKLKELFGSKLPEISEDKRFASKEEEKRIRGLWPAGHAAGIKRLDYFLKKKAKTYAKYRSDPARDCSSRLSPYFAAGIISVREAMNRAKEADDGDDLGGGDVGIASWVRELVFREFYRQQIIITPHKSMNLPQNLKFDHVQWEEDEVGWQKWCEGKTGVPFVDAGMRQLNHEAFMHNRLRMNVSSYLRTNLLIDYRKGERYFADHLIDWDLCNNTYGWDPSYTIFNAVSQAEKCDPEGDYIRKWIPELKNIKGKAIFAPHERLSKAEFNKLNYPAPHVDFKKSKDRCMARYKEATQGSHD